MAANEEQQKLLHAASRYMQHHCRIIPCNTSNLDLWADSYVPICIPARILEQHLRRDAQPLVKGAHHRQAQRSFII
jgi:hypothetical protein